MLLVRENSAVVLIDVQEKLTPLVLHHEVLVERCQWLLKLAQQMNVPIVVSEQYTKGLGVTVEALRQDVDVVNCFEKIHFSCASDTQGLTYLKALQRKQLILMGIEAHVCVMQSALELLEQGFEVFVVVDAISSRKALDMKYALKRMHSAGVHLITTEMVFFEWLRRAGTPEFKSLSKAFLQG